MSVNGPNKNLKLNISFQELYQKEAVEDASCVMQLICPTTPAEAGMKGLEMSDSSGSVDINSNNISKFRHIPMIMFGGNALFETLEKLQPNVAICADAQISEAEAHQYRLRIDGDNIIVKEPHNSSNEKNFTREEFLKKFNGGLPVMIM